MSLDYDNVKSEISSVIQKSVAKDLNLTNGFNRNIEDMREYCLQNNNSDFVFKEKDITFVITCDSISKGNDAIIEEGIGNLVEESYYKNYECGFINCFEEMTYPFFLISQQTKDKAGKYFYLFTTISIILIALIFVLAEKRSNTFIIAGSLLILSALPFMKANWFFSNSEKIFLQFLTIFLSESFKVFVIGMVIGIILLIIGIILKFFNIGFKINELISKFKKSETEKTASPPVVQKDISSSESSESTPKKTKAQKE